MQLIRQAADKEGWCLARLGEEAEQEWPSETPPSSLVLPAGRPVQTIRAEALERGLQRALERDDLRDSHELEHPLNALAGETRRWHRRLATPQRARLCGGR